MCFVFLQRGKGRKKILAKPATNKYNNNLQSYQSTCEEHRKYIKKKKTICHHLFPYISSCVTYLAKSCGVFVLSPELCLSPAARLPLQSCLNFHHSGTQAHKKCPKIKQVLPLAAGRKKIKIKIKLHI